MLNTVITGTGSYIPQKVVTNATFTQRAFYDKDKQRIEQEGTEIIRKFQAITGIEERRYVENDQMASNIAAIAAEKAIEDARIDPESLDQIIVAQNFGDVISDTIQTDNVPSLAARVKHHLQIRNPSCIAYDVLFGCPGWVQGVIMADNFIQNGTARKIMVIGAETLSRVIDPHDRDSMIYSDGAGATVVEGLEEHLKRGVLAHTASSYTYEEANFLRMGASYKPDSDSKIRFIKMDGRKIYNFALLHVPEAMKQCLDKADLDIHDIKKVFIHQANAKMDHAIITRLYELYNAEPPSLTMPMSIHKFGNSSVATVPTLYDLVLHGKRQDHELHPGDTILFASVGAGMNINAIAYKV